ncbi:hypothetical protein NIES2098_38360 [Calothrix sp. NIES-2098]|nr:hypothetical protein NIES2098_38360 [Calothrix sp. NIES-2098]
MIAIPSQPLCIFVTKALYTRLDFKQFEIFVNCDTANY